MSVEPKDQGQPTARTQTSSLAIQVAVLSQKLEQSEQLVEELKRREEASKKAYSMLLNAFNDIKGTESEVLIKSLRDEIMLLKRDKDHDTYMLRNQCTEILNLVQSSMKKGSYNHPTSRHASVSRDPYRNDDRNRDLGEVASVHRFVIDGQDDDISAKRGENGATLNRRPSDSASQREIYKKNETTDSQFFTHRSKTDQPKNVFKTGQDLEENSAQLERVKAQLIKKSNKISKLQEELAQRDATILALQRRIVELTHKNDKINFEELKVERPVDLRIERMDTYLVGNYPSLRNAPKPSHIIQTNHILMMKNEPKMVETYHMKIDDWTERRMKETSVDYNLEPPRKLRDSSDLSNQEPTSERYLGPEGGLTMSPSSLSKIKIDENKAHSKSPNELSCKFTKQNSNLDIDNLKPRGSNQLNHSKLPSFPPIRKTTSYQCIPAGSLMSSYYGLKREDSRDTLQGESVRSTEVEKLMLENRKVTKDLRRMFEQFNSVEGIEVSEDQTPTGKSARRTIGTTDKVDPIKQDGTNSFSGEKRTINSNRKAQQLLLQEYMENGIMETRAEDLQDDSDLHAKAPTGSITVSKTGSKINSPILGQSGTEKSLHRIGGIAFDKNSRKSNQSSGAIGSRLGSQHDLRKREDLSKNTSPRQVSHKASPPTFNIELDIAEKNGTNNKIVDKQPSITREMASNQSKGSLASRSPRNDGTKNVSIRVIEDNSDEKCLSATSSQDNLPFGHQRRRLNGFVDTFKGADIDIEDIRSPEHEPEDNIYPTNQLPGLPVALPEIKNFSTKNNLIVKVSSPSQTMHLSYLDEHHNLSPSNKGPNRERPSPPTASLLPNNLHLEIVEPSLSSNCHNESHLYQEDRKNCSPRKIPSSHRSMAGSQFLDPFIDGMNPQAVSSRNYPEETACEPRDRFDYQPSKLGKFIVERWNTALEQAPADDEQCDGVMIGSRSHSNVSKRQEQRQFLQVDRKKAPGFIEEPWFQQKPVQGAMESEVQARYRFEAEEQAQVHAPDHKFLLKIENRPNLHNFEKEETHKRLNSGNQRYLATIPHFDSSYPEDQLRPGTSINPSEYETTEPKLSKRMGSQDKDRKTEGQKKLLWQASGVSIREIATHSGFSPDKRSPGQEIGASPRNFDNKIPEKEFVLYKRGMPLDHQKPVSTKYLLKNMSGTSLAKSDLTEKGKGQRNKSQIEKTSYQDLLHYIKPGGNQRNPSREERSRSRKAHSVINHQPGYLDDTETKSIRSNLSGFHVDGRKLTTNEKKQMKFKTDYCGLIKHIAINLVEDSNSTSNSGTPGIEISKHKTRNLTGVDANFGSFMAPNHNSANGIEAKTEIGFLKQYHLPKKVHTGLNPELQNMRLSPISGKSGLNSRRVSQYSQANTTLNITYDAGNLTKQEIDPVHKRRNSQIPQTVKQATPIHSRRPSNASVTLSQKSQTSKMGIGQKGKIYLNKGHAQEPPREKGSKEPSSLPQAKVTEPSSGVDLYKPRPNKENKLKHETSKNRAFVHNEYHMTSLKQDASKVGPTSSALKSSKAENSFLGVRINDIQNLYGNDGGPSSQRNTDRSNNYVLKCKGSPLSNCKYADLSRNSENNLYCNRQASKQGANSTQQDNGPRVFGRQISNTSQLNSSSCGLFEKHDISIAGPQKLTVKPESPATKAKDKERASYMSRLNETVYSAHDSIVMMHEILVDKVSDLHHKLIVHERSSSKKTRYLPRSTLEPEDRINGK